MSAAEEASTEGGGGIEPTSVVKSDEAGTTQDGETGSGDNLPASRDDGPDGGGEVAPLLGGRIVDVIADAITFTVVIARLAIAATAMRLLSQAVKGAYSYVEGCAKTVDHLADVAAALKVDDRVTSAHHDAAGVMRETLAEADALAEEAAEMSTEFDNAARDHQSDYGDVNEAMQSGDYDIAESEWYSNR